MIFQEPQALRLRIAEITGRPAREKSKIFEDTSAFMSIDGGDLLRLAGNDYLVLGNAREGRFGIDDQPKYWVKTAIDLTNGHRKIIKLVFEEYFTGHIGSEIFHCRRSAVKESAVLEAMRGHPFFMQGVSVPDEVGNLVRILDFLPGLSLYEFLRRINEPHQEYYHNKFPEMIQMLIQCIEAIAQLHRKRLYHGDIRADHLLLERPANTPKWIDFDYLISYPYYDIYCLGNVLLQVVGKGRHSSHDIRWQPLNYPDFNENLNSADMSRMFPHRVANLRKLFPYLSADLNEILMHFAVECLNPYRDLDTLLSELRSLFPPLAGHSDNSGSPDLHL
jgi:hypothetical protein